MNFIPESEIVSQFGQQICQKIDVTSQKWELFRRRKAVSLKDFLKASQNTVRKRKFYKAKVVIQNSATRYYHEFHLKLHKYLEMLMLTAAFLLLT